MLILIRRSLKSFHMTFEHVAVYENSRDEFHKQTVRPLTQVSNLLGSLFIFKAKIQFKKFILRLVACFLCLRNWDLRFITLY